MFEFNTTAALIAVCSALPFVATSSFFGIKATYATGFWDSVGYGLYAYWINYFGLPLTWVAIKLSAALLKRMGYDDISRSKALTIVFIFILDAVFIFQWVIWSQLIVLIWKALFR